MSADTSAGLPPPHSGRRSRGPSGHRVPIHDRCHLPHRRRREAGRSRPVRRLRAVAAPDGGAAPGPGTAGGAGVRGGRGGDRAAAGRTGAGGGDGGVRRGRGAAGRLHRRHRDVARPGQPGTVLVLRPVRDAAGRRPRGPQPGARRGGAAGPGGLRSLSRRAGPGVRRGGGRRAGRARRGRPGDRDRRPRRAVPAGAEHKR